MGLRIFVAGKSGQVAQSLLAAATDDVTLELFGRPDFDITDRQSITASIEAFSPDIVINAAAYTAVDQAEDEREAAFAVNAEGPRFLAEVTAERSIPIIHLSTDYVFDGSASTPYRVHDQTAPLGVYGESKYAGEVAVASSNPKHIIARTAWVYGTFGKNFLKTMLRVAGSNDTLRVVSDQRGAPTSSHAIAEMLLAIAGQVAEQGDGAPFGLYHLVAEGETNWADFASAIFQASAEHGGPVADVEAITTAEYPTKAKRPQYSVLDTSRLQEAFGLQLSDWREPVNAIVEHVLKEDSFS